MRQLATHDRPHPLRWRDVYREAELYKAAIRVYTKPLFQWRKALNTSTDGKTLYDLAGRGLRGLDALHRLLARESFQFRPSMALKYNFNGKRRTLYIPPWEERIVDLLLYRLLNRKLHRWFAPDSYAYRDRSLGLDSCQQKIAGILAAAREPVYVVKRDIRDYFASVDHELLLAQLARLVDPGDYLFRLLKQRVRFSYQDEEGSHIAEIGIPFGCASACVFANVYLTEMDRAVAVPGVSYFRYADDILLLSGSREAISEASEQLAVKLAELRLGTKASHEADLVAGLSAGRGLTAPQRLKPLSLKAPDRRAESAAPPKGLASHRDVGAGPFEGMHADSHFAAVSEFRHLGLLFRAGGAVALSRDKQRKIENLFRFAFRRSRRKWGKIADPRERARTLCAIADETVAKGVRNVAIVDYYLKHVSDEEQLRRLDRWLAEEVLSMVFGGHRKGNFAKISFAELRGVGLPSLVHRRRLIRGGRVETPFFIWQKQKAARAFRGTVARLVRASSGHAAFSPGPEAAANKRP